MEDLPPHIQKLYDLGRVNRDNLLAAIKGWPMGEYSKLLSYRSISSHSKNPLIDALTAIRRWIHQLARAVEGISIYDEKHITDLFAKLETAVKSADDIGTLTYDVEECINEMLLIT